jgi:acetyltransferase-like isoleucine patch superfamily enzyme
MTIVAEIGIEPYHSKAYLAWLSSVGYIARTVHLPKVPMQLGKHVFLGDGIKIDCSDTKSGIILSDHVAIYGNSFLEAGSGARIYIGDRTHIQPGCHIHAHLQNIKIGSSVEIGPNCGLYSYNHGKEIGTSVMNQCLESHGETIIENGVWLGHGVIVLSGVRIGHDSVVGAGAVVTRNIPANSIAAGIPAKVIGFR